MRRLPTALAAVLAGALLPAAAAAQAPTPRERTLYADAPSGMHLLDSGWTTRPDPRGAGLRQRWQRPGMDTGFRRVSVPHAFNDRTPRGFRAGIQWYRLKFTRPAAAGATGWRLRFESVNRRADVFLNGRTIGTHEGAYLPFELPARDIREGQNEVVVRVDGRLGGRDLFPTSPSARGWWNWGGILREVYLRRVTALELSDLQVQAEPGNPARVTVNATVRNMTGQPQPLDAQLTVRGRGTNIARAPGAGTAIAPGAAQPFSDSFEIPNPRLWTPASPSLYSLRIALGGQVTSTRFGIRSWSVDRRGRALLNGEPLSLRGASFHEETAARGGALRARDRQAIAASLEALGANFTRVHYPPHPALLEEFDRRGIVFWEQAPVWRVPAGRLAALKGEALSRLREMVLRDRNHASVMTWSVENEIVRGGAAEADYLRDARELVKGLDPTRLVAADVLLSPFPGSAAYRDLDALGINEYFGWYRRSRTEDLAPRLDQLRSSYPEQALFAVEFGAEANRPGPASQKGTFAFQSRYLSTHLGLLGTSPAGLSGSLVWALRDFAVRPGWAGGNPRPDPPVNHKGLLTESGRRKPAFETVRRLFRGGAAGRQP